MDQKELASIEGFDEETAGELQTRASDHLAKLEAELDAKRRELGVEDAVKEVPGVTSEMLVKFGENDIKTVEDLVQETYVRMYALRDFREIESPRALLFRIAHNTAVERARRQAAQSDGQVTYEHIGGVLLGGVPGVAPAKVAILGGGVSGVNAAQMAVGMRADVTQEADVERTTYGVIAVVPNLDHSGYVLMMEGINMAGTEGAADFLMSDRATPLIERLIRDHTLNSPFEILIETSNIGATAPEPRMIAERIR